MARKLIPREFYREISKRIDCTDDRAQFIWQEIVDLIVNELISYNEILLPNLGDLRSITRGGKEIHVPVDPQHPGEIRRVYVDPYQSAQFRASQKFKDTINGVGHTRSEIMKQREAYRKYREQEEFEKKQAEYVELYENAVERMKQQHLERKEKLKMINKLSYKKRKELEQKENSYWEDFDEEED